MKTYNNDLISREAALNALDNERKILIEQERFGAEHIVVHHARRLIEELPAVDTVPVEWLEDKLNATAVTNPDLNNAIFYTLVAWEQHNHEQEAR